MKIGDWKIIILSSVLGAALGIGGTALLLRFHLLGSAGDSSATIPGFSQAVSRPRSPVDQACQQDAEKLCGSEVSENRRDACLQENIKKVSSDCRSKLELVRSSFAACEREIAKYCPQAGYGGGRMIRCLGDYYDELSPGCQQRAGLRR